MNFPQSTACVANLLLFLLISSAATFAQSEEPKSPEVKSKEETAQRLFQAGKWEQAREAYEAVLPKLTGSDAADAMIKIGYTWQRSHKHENALPWFRRVLKLEDIETQYRSGALLRLGYSLRLLKRGEEGIAILDQAAAVQGAPSEHTAEALLYAAWEHNTREEHEAAIQKFRKVGEVPDVHQNYTATAYLSIGRILQKKKQYEAALKEYKKIATLKTVASKNRARARVAILECEALLEGDTPFHIKPYLSKVETTSAKLFWVSQGEIPAGTVTLKTGEDKLVGGEIKPETSPLKETICHLHTALLKDLSPNTRYQYEVKCDGKTMSGSFKTAPESGTPFSFCLIGDTQSYNTGLQPLLDAMGKAESDFVLHVGDITDRGDLWGEWKGSFFDPGWAYLKNQTFWPVYGNHDGGPYFPALFELPEGLWYSFDWGDAHVIVLDSYGAGTGGRGREKQLAWLEADLKANKKPWTFAALHVPMVATRKSLDWFGETDFLPLLEKHGVDVVFSGHHPHYRRYHPIGSSNRKPILHITSGGGGGPVGGYMPSPVLAQGIDVNHFCRIQVTPTTFQLTAHAISGAVIDRFQLTKADKPKLAATAVDTTQAKSIISLYQELLTDRTYELRMMADKAPTANQTVKLTLDLSTLPRGPLDPAKFAEDEILMVESTKESNWKIAPQSFRLRDGIGHFEATLSSTATLKSKIDLPTAHLRLQLKKGTRIFESCEALTRIQLKAQ